MPVQKSMENKFSFFELADMSTFPFNISSKVKKLQMWISFASKFEKTMFMLLIAL